MVRYYKQHKTPYKVNPKSIDRETLLAEGEIKRKGKAPSDLIVGLVVKRVTEERKCVKYTVLCVIEGELSLRCCVGDLRNGAGNFRMFELMMRAEFNLRSWTFVLSVCVYLMEARCGL